MGYTSELSGEITFDPPLSWRELRDSGLFPHPEQLTGSYRYLLQLQVEEQVKETDEGTVTTRSARKIIPAFEDPVKAYNIEGDLAEFLPLLGTRAVTGYILREGELQGDVERYSIVDGKVVTEKAELRWPNGDKVDL